MKERNDGCISTYSIVGCDTAAGEVGIAVQSKFLAVGNVVPWAKGGVGAIATQAWANVAYGIDGLKLLEQGMHPEEVVSALIKQDEGCETRQFGVVNIKGQSATFTGKECSEWAGGIAGENFAAQGNILVGEATVQALADTFQSTGGDLTERLMRALEEAQKVGGDRRGMQSAAIYVAKEGAGYGGVSDTMVDIRVDDHKQPIKELRRVLELYRFFLFKTEEGNVSEIKDEIKDMILSVLAKTGYYSGSTSGAWDEAMHNAFHEFSLVENFDERLQPFGLVDNEVVAFMRKNY